MTPDEIRALDDYTPELFLKQVEHAIAERIAGRVVSYSIHGRSVQHMSLDELRVWRNALQEEVAAANNPGGYNVLVRRGSPQ